MTCTRDPVKGFIWAYTSKSVFKFRMQREARDVWPVFLSRNEFDLARRYCAESGGDLDVVIMREAEHLYENKKYAESARLYADSRIKLPEVMDGIRGMLPPPPFRVRGIVPHPPSEL